MVIQLGKRVRGQLKTYDDGTGEIPIDLSGPPDERWRAAFTEEAESAGLRATIGESAGAPVALMHIVPGQLRKAYDRLRDVVDLANERCEFEAKAG